MPAEPRIVPGMDSPSVRWELVTKSDTVDLPRGVPRALLVGIGGTLNTIDQYDTTATGVPVLAGYNPICPKRILTGGTADNIWALY